MSSSFLGRATRLTPRLKHTPAAVGRRRPPWSATNGSLRRHHTGGRLTRSSVAVGARNEAMAAAALAPSRAPAGGPPRDVTGLPCPRGALFTGAFSAAAVAHAVGVGYRGLETGAGALDDVGGAAARSVAMAGGGCGDLP